VFCAIALARTHPRRFGSTFEVYLDYAQRLAQHQPAFDPTTLDGFNYWPATLVAYRPFLAFDPVVAAALALVLSAALFSFAALRLTQAVLDDRSARATAAAGVLLLINIPVCWFNFKYVQAGIAMTAGMMLSAAAMMRVRWRLASLWLFIAATIKPLAAVMILLSGALQARMRLWLALALLAIALLPFAVADYGYVIATYRDWALKLVHMGTVLPTEWPFQADFTTMLDSAGVVVPPRLATPLRLAGALATLALAWRAVRAEDHRALPLALLVLSGCFITLFGPRNEHISFIVLTPGLTALALLLLGRDAADRTGWLLIAAALLLGGYWTPHTARWLEPAIVTVLYLWFVWLMAVPQRWNALIAGTPRPQTALQTI
jgi:hypothetical protein